MAVLLASGIVLSGCGRTSNNASLKDYTACYQLGFFNNYMQLGNSSGKPVPTSMWDGVMDSAVKASDPKIVGIGHAIQRDLPIAQDGVNPKPLANDLVHLLAACKSLNWQGSPDPATHAPTASQ